MSAPPTVRAAVESHVGRVRKTNEDSTIFEPGAGLYAVLDGMGGANAGDVASQTARDALRDYILSRRLNAEPQVLLEAGIQAACASVWSSAQAARERHGMGTTVVACLVVDGTAPPFGGAAGRGQAPTGDAKRAIIAHVGDSRAYLLRGGRLQTLTRDHTVVEELVERGMLSREEAVRHPYKNVLSRNLGSRAETRVDVREIAIQPGDRVLLCSDGLYGYASAEGIQYILGSGDASDHVARDLIDLALRGGGGDNVSTIVIEAPPAPPSGTELVRTRGATSWWHARSRFVQVARDHGLARNPICRGLRPEEALELIALSLCEAIYHDLEKSTGVNVWTFAQNLGGGWFDRVDRLGRGEGGDGTWAPLRALVDILTSAARAVIDEIRAADSALGFLLDIAVSRALVVAELAIGGLLGERLRGVDGDLVHIHAAIRETVHEMRPDETEPKFLEQATIPFLHLDRPVTNSGISVELVTGIEQALTISRAQIAPRAELARSIISALETIATDTSGNFASAVVAARELYGVRTVDDAGIMPLFDALDQTRIVTAASVHQIGATEAIRAKVLSAIGTAHQRLAGAFTGIVLEAVSPYSERLRTAQSATSKLRDQVARTERRRAELEHKLATTVDQSRPWDKRGTTEW